MAFEGGEDLARNLLTLSKAVRRRVLFEALEEVGEPIRRRMSQLAPHAPGAPDLRANIGMSRIRRVGSVEGGRWESTDEHQAAIAIGPTKGFAYGLPQEYGTRFHGAQPFARPAFDEGAPKALPELAAILWRELAARGLSRLVSVNAPISSPRGGGLL